MSETTEKKEKWTSGDAYEIWMARWSKLLAPQFLDWLQVPPGKEWVDVCCGTGILSLAIAEGHRPTRVVGIDRAEAQIEFARQRRGGVNITYKTGDAMALPEPDAAFDACVCGLGLNFISEPAKGLGEMMRVTRPGGVIAAYVWEYSGQTRFLREFWDAAIAVDPEAAQFDQGRRFPICTPEGLRTAFVETGLENVETRPLDIVTRFESFEDYWQPFLLGQGSGPTYLAPRSEAIRTAIRERLRGALPIAADGSISLGARALAVRGTRA